MFRTYIKDFMIVLEGAPKHPKCKGTYDEMTGDYDCDYNTKLDCEECMYGVGRKNPEARCNEAK